MRHFMGVWNEYYKCKFHTQLQKYIFSNCYTYVYISILNILKMLPTDLVHNLQWLLQKIFRWQKIRWTNITFCALLIIQWKSSCSFHDMVCITPYRSPGNRIKCVSYENIYQCTSIHDINHTPSKVEYQRICSCKSKIREFVTNLHHR